MPQPAKNLGKLPPYLFAEIDKKIDDAKAKGIDLINLGVGDPDLATPARIVSAMQQAVGDAATHNYPPYQGTEVFRHAVVNWMDKRFGVEVNPANEVISLIGSKEGLAHMILAYVDPGDVVLCPSPGYPVYNNYTLLCGGQPYTLPLKADNGFLPDLAAIPADIAQRAKLLFLNYPNNPTGAIATTAFIEEAVAFCKKYDILLCHDNAYSEMTFDDYQAPSFLEVPGAKDVCVEFFSLSKMYNMTGWRVGFAVGNVAGIKALSTVKNNTDSGVFKAVQVAAAEGLNHSAELTRDLNAIYGKRRDLFLAGLAELGWPVTPNVATFYLWLPVPQGMTSLECVTALREKAHIVVPPGTGYGPEGEGFFRVALTVSEDRLTQALQQIKAAGIRYSGLQQTVA
jgi:LL-diaminopimelate aminotransferase